MWRRIGLALACATVLSAALPAASAQETLERVVVLSRHGVRSPTQHAHELAAWAARPWPAWPVPRGWLTERGADLLRWSWAGTRSRWLRHEACPPPDSLVIHADLDERTRASAAAILEGLAPGCGLKASLSAALIDPLFHPVKAGVCYFDPQTARRAVASVGAGLPALAGELAPQLEAVSRLAARPLPPESHIKASKRTVEIKGALGQASSMVEIFALEWGQWPAQSPAWGQLDEASLATLMPVHVRVFAQVNRAPYVAARRGSALAQAMIDRLSAQQAPALSIWVGHDTNIANVAALLGLSWQAPGRARDEIPPGSALVIERWRVKGEIELRAYAFAPSPEQMHSAAPQGQAVLTPALWSECGERCSLAQVQARLAGRIEPGCIAP